MGRADLSKYDDVHLPMRMGGNVFVDGAKPCSCEKDPLVEPGFNRMIRLITKADGLFLQIRFDKSWTEKRTRKLVTTQLLGDAIIPHLPYQRPDGMPVEIDRDYFGAPRKGSDPTPGPFERLEPGLQLIKVW